MVLNETAAKFMNLSDPVGQTIKLTLFDKTTSFKVIGVIKDMLMESPYEPVRKTIYMIDKSGGSVINIRLNPHLSTREALAKIEATFKKYDPASPFVYTFVNDAYARKFSEEERTGKLALMFAGLAIFISCLGIFGLASFVAGQRSKEISIRKILGASMTNLWRLLSGDFVMLVIIAFFIAAPLSWYLMKDWLQQYEYRTTLSWHIFAVAGMGAVVITLLTVSYHAIKAVLINPATHLKSE
jgi:ABC-type antimicrobial peptide transport system permease subunit